MSRSPCPRDCPGRSPTCHASCETYNAWRRQHEPERAELIARAERERVYSDVFFHSVERCARVREHCNNAATRQRRRRK